mmetsp:Transcript_8890/g.26855  ORF Transcript_8890/g.26855 Transcript_8890/m.26855 type:complete len:662 (-) Transcript_8890:67-2052(-)
MDPLEGLPPLDPQIGDAIFGVGVDVVSALDVSPLGAAAVGGPALGPAVDPPEVLPVQLPPTDLEPRTGPLSAPVIAEASRAAAKRKAPGFGFELDSASQRLKISYKIVETADTIATIELSDTHVQNICRIFDDVDSNGDGQIDMHDFIAPGTLNVHSRADGFSWWRAFKSDLANRPDQETFSLSDFVYAFKNQLLVNQLESKWDPHTEGLEGKPLQDWVESVEHRFNSVILERIVTAHNWQRNLGIMSFNFRNRLIPRDNESYQVVVSLSLEPWAKDRIVELFTLLDTWGPEGRPDGKLSQDDFTDFADMAVWHELHETFDTDGDGYIDFQEFKDGFIKWVRTQTPMKASFAPFSKMDGWLHLMQSTANKAIDQLATHLTTTIMAAKTKGKRSVPAGAAAHAAAAVLDAPKAAATAAPGFVMTAKVFKHCVERNVAGNVNELKAQIHRVEGMSAVLVAEKSGAMYNLPSKFITLVCRKPFREVLEKAGASAAELRGALETGERFWIVLFPNEGNMHTTWPELFSSIRCNDAPVWKRLTRFAKDLMDRPFDAIQAVAQVGYLRGATYSEVDELGAEDDRYMSQQRFLKTGAVTLAHARGYLYNELKRDETMGVGSGIDWATVRYTVQFAVSAGPDLMHEMLGSGKCAIDGTALVAAALKASR